MNKTSPKNLVAVERAQKAWELRKTGATYEAIGKVLGVTAQAAYKAVKKYYDRAETETTETAAEAKRLELERLDIMLLAIWPKARAGDVRAVAEARAIGAERRKILGLDAPTKSALTNPEGTEAAQVGAFVLPMPLDTQAWTDMAATARDKKA